MVFLCSFFLQSRGWLLPFQELLVILIASEPLCGTYYKPMRLASVVQHLRNKSFVNSVPDRMWVPAIERGSTTWRLTAADLCRRRQTVTAGLCRRRKTAMGVDRDRQSITPQAFPTVSVCASIQCCVYTEYMCSGYRRRSPTTCLPIAKGRLTSPTLLKGFGRGETAAAFVVIPAVLILMCLTSCVTRGPQSAERKWYGPRPSHGQRNSRPLSVANPRAHLRLWGKITSGLVECMQGQFVW